MSFRRVVSVLLLVAYLPACTSYQATSQPLAELTAQPKIVEKIRVTTTDGAAIEVDGPRVVNDSLFGTTVTTGPRGDRTTRAVAIPLGHLQAVEVRRFDGTKTRWLVGGLMLGFLVVYVVSSCAADDWFC